MKTIAFAAFFLAALVSAGNFLAGHLAVREIPADILTFWRTFIAALVMLPLAAWKSPDLWAHFRRNPARILLLSLVGVVGPPLMPIRRLAACWCSVAYSWLHAVYPRKVMRESINLES